MKQPIIIKDYISDPKIDINSITKETEFWIGLKNKLTPAYQEDQIYRNLDKRILIKAFLSEQGYDQYISELKVSDPEQFEKH